MSLTKVKIYTFLFLNYFLNTNFKFNSIFYNCIHSKHKSLYSLLTFNHNSFSIINSLCVIKHTVRLGLKMSGIQLVWLWLDKNWFIVKLETKSSLNILHVIQKLETKSSLNLLHVTKTKTNIISRLELRIILYNFFKYNQVNKLFYFQTHI